MHPFYISTIAPHLQKMTQNLEAAIYTYYGYRFPINISEEETTQLCNTISQLQVKSNLITANVNQQYDSYLHHFFDSKGQSYFILGIETTSHEEESVSSLSINDIFVEPSISNVLEFHKFMDNLRMQLTPEMQDYFCIDNETTHICFALDINKESNDKSIQAINKKILNCLY